VDGRSDLEQFDLAEEASTDGDERLLRPLVEPVDAGRVGDGRELATSHTQCAADRWETQHHLHAHTRTTHTAPPGTC